MEDIDRETFLKQYKIMESRDKSFKEELKKNSRKSSIVITPLDHNPLGDQ
jgi:hypothetical protein